MSPRNEKESILKLIVQRLLNLVSYLLEVIKQKDEQLKAKYRLVDWFERKGVGYCKVHLIGTSSVNDYAPEEIVADDDFISGFSQLDIRTITNLANYERYKPKSVVTTIYHEDRIVEITERGKATTTIINEKIQDKIEEFSKRDAFNLGRIIGENDARL